ncbi:hypothetical protein GCM10022407_33990 [Hymenobacter antarcticus]|uniref:Uncharacterized protein n=1 Tax=Hymenobacter antarcticus TaxID=486270 RepID=A0ABP7QRV4_9BACT
MLMPEPAAKPGEAGIRMVFLLFGKGCKGGGNYASTRRAPAGCGPFTFIPNP